MTLNSENVLQSRLVRWTILIAFSAVTLSFHYGIFGMKLPVGDLFRRLCYIPILLGAFWFGLWGGLGMASGISVAVIPHVMMVSRMKGDVGGELIEIFFYFLLGGMFGLLVDRERRIDRARKESERKLAHAERLSSLGEMAGHLAHEIKNPLGSIRGAAEIIIPVLDKDDPKREFGDILLEEVGRLNRVVENFLQYARKMDLKLETVPLGELLSTVAKQVEVASGNPDMKVSLKVEGEPAAYCDREKLKQVFLNLALNAVRAMPDGGSLEFSAWEDDSGASVAVRDTGRGIEKANIGKIFDPFFTTDPGGSGLGLAISERIVSEHGGKIDVESSPGRGAVFTVFIPSKDLAGKR